ncbi:inward rectifier potassium channel 2 [Tribolium castaneum]|uniref:Inward rectifier potassium channel 2-like Protein n=1 Tax=Tribolium castaneum TaxID=7070 RepID=A0A139WBX6_TRICA|nr:PREDICTED: inward rectifier potassium channel 2 [Tribolium castaneum]KYB25424.1 Inward rectifier potassium channel 2-like Protein [Tribolium castaneum]|eukprot:XP_008198507.1 PREDICTED: inward rectifier potassium channel 2 [Tribolium castaneum]
MSENFPLVLKKIEKKSLRKIKIRRLMSKTGHINLDQTHLPSKYLRFTKDLATTLVQVRWRWVTLFVTLSNAFFYLIFAGLWMLDAWLSGDFAKTQDLCIQSNKHFTSYLLLSIESITTTGYGYLYPSDHCKIAWIILTLNTFAMILLDGAFTSIVILKICKPLKREFDSIFSRNAVLSLRNGKLCLILRISDHLNKHLISPEIKLYFVSDNFELQELEIHSDTMLLWPSDIVHEIGEESPLWALSPRDFFQNRFEIFVTVSGSSLITNQFATSQTSYINEEIRWGFRFKSCFEYDQKLQRYVMSGDVFKLEPCDTPLCSAKKLKEIKNGLGK